jgi:hypothetical protein
MLTAKQQIVLVAEAVILLMITITFWIALGWFGGVISGVISLLAWSACAYALLALNLTPNPADRTIDS